MKNLKDVTLEMSLKPFRSVEKDAVEAVCRQAFGQWEALTRHADRVSVLLWASDGSEILDYAGDRDAPFEWARYIGGANRRTDWDHDEDPEGIGLHTTCYLYTPDPPVFTYRILAQIVAALRKIGRAVTGKPIRVGATFDPGPEFARSPFKYERHPELLRGDTLGQKSFLCCYASLHADNRRYAGFPSGIPEGTPFGTFFGRQCQRFLGDLGFDYIWLSNGLGFGSETWGVTGAVFDGTRFDTEKIEPTQERILDFWRLFRAQCPDFGVETRGTNLTAGVDLASDAVDLDRLYRGGFRFLPPPNSPWAALNGDFGLEIAGYLSRIAELPEEGDYLFRYYVHDPWWMNSPWIDRYEGQPHDIYLPLAVSRVGGDGNVALPSHLNLLTIDNSLGEMPERCPLEVIPHLLTAYEHAPDAPAPLTWVYPFREYCARAVLRPEKPFFEDWLIKSAINRGLPLSAVVSSDNFARSRAGGLYRGSVVVAPMPEKDGGSGKALIDHVMSGGKVLLYGSAHGADPALLDLINLGFADGLSGELSLAVDGETRARRIIHDPLLSDGAVDTVVANPGDLSTQVLASVEKGGETRAYAVCRALPEWCGGAVVWLRGTNSSYYQKGAQLLTPRDTAVYYSAEDLFLTALRRFGYGIAFDEVQSGRVPVIMLCRHENAFYFSCYSPDTTVETRLCLPLGAPVFFGGETKYSGGAASYRFPRALHAECRAFVTQPGPSTLSCREEPPVSFQMARRYRISGLADATVRILPRPGEEKSTEVLLNATYPNIVGQPLRLRRYPSPYGPVIEAENVTGSLLVSTPRQ